MSLFKTYPPTELNLDTLCCMSPRNVLEYIKDMHEAHEKRVNGLKESLKDFILENHELSQENIGLKDDKKAMAQIMEERAEQSAQTVRDLNETIEGLREEIAILQQDAKEDKELRRLALEVCNGIDQGGCRLDDDTKEAYDALWAYREELYGVPYSEEEAPEQESVTPAQAWACFKDSKESLWKECFSECNKDGFHPHTIQFSEWCVRDEEGDIVDSGEGKPKKATIQEHYATGMSIRLYAFNKREEWTMITWFDGKEWVFEELINVD